MYFFPMTLFASNTYEVMMLPLMFPPCLGDKMPERCLDVVKTATIFKVSLLYREIRYLGLFGVVYVQNPYTMFLALNKFYILSQNCIYSKASL